MKSLTERIRTDLTAKILSGIYPPGGKLPTERDYAKQSGVSRVTVRRVYDQLERSGIIVRRRPLGTRVSDTFRAHGGPLENIGLITTLPHTFSGQFVEAVSRRCEELDALLVLGIPEPDTGERQLEIALRMASRGVRDLIVWGADRGFDFSVFERLRILGVNLVFYDQVIPGPFADYVGLDNAGAMRLLLEQAVGMAHRSFSSSPTPIWMWIPTPNAGMRLKRFRIRRSAAGKCAPSAERAEQRLAPTRSGTCPKDGGKRRTHGRFSRSTRRFCCACSPRRRRGGGSIAWTVARS